MKRIWFLFFCIFNLCIGMDKAKATWDTFSEKAYYVWFRKRNPHTHQYAEYNPLSLIPVISWLKKENIDINKTLEFAQSDCSKNIPSKLSWQGMKDLLFKHTIHDKYRHYFLLKAIQKTNSLSYEIPPKIDLSWINTFMKFPEEDKKESILHTEYQKPQYQVFFKARELFYTRGSALKQEFTKHIPDQKKVEPKKIK